MTAQQKFLWLVGGLVGALALASLIGATMAWRLKPGQNRDVVDNLNARIRAWWGMVVVLVTAILVGPSATLILFALMSFFALREFITLAPTRPGDHLPLFISFFLLIPGQYLLIGYDHYGSFAIFIPVYAFLLLPAIAALVGDVEDFLSRQAKIQWGVMIAVYCVSYAPALLLLDIPGYDGQNALLMFYLLLIVQMSDVFQYVFGKLFGHTKIAPVVSPSKTVEGLAGGGLTAMLIGAAMWWITPFTPLQAFAVSFVIVGSGFLGGLALSAMKRSLGAKDWGVMIEGHGGMLDRLDSVCFAAPIFFHITRFFMT
jgi:phosphatidate cytidylyltransferase